MMAPNTQDTEQRLDRRLAAVVDPWDIVQESPAEAPQHLPEFLGVGERSLGLRHLRALLGDEDGEA